MTHGECTIGQAVWAKAGSTGWRPAVIEFARKSGMIALVFESGSRGGGSRSPEHLMPRNPALRGKDRPAASLAKILSDASV